MVYVSNRHAIVIHRVNGAFYINEDRSTEEEYTASCSGNLRSNHKKNILRTVFTKKT